MIGRVGGSEIVGSFRRRAGGGEGRIGRGLDEELLALSSRSSGVRSYDSEGITSPAGSRWIAGRVRGVTKEGSWVSP